MNAFKLCCSLETIVSDIDIWIDKYDKGYNQDANVPEKKKR